MFLPNREDLSIIGGKWTLLILWDLYNGTKRFCQLQKSLQGISPKTLPHRLQELEKEGIVSKKVYPEVPPRVEYSLTPRGESLKEIVLALAEWGNKYYDNKEVLVHPRTPNRDVCCFS